MLKTFYFLIFLLFSSNIFGQDVNVLLSNFETEKDSQKKSELAYQIALQYQQSGGYKKSIDYFQKSLQNAQTNPIFQANCYKKIINSYIFLQDYKEAIQTADLLLENLQTQNNQNETIILLNQISDYAQRSENYEKALKTNLNLEEIYKKQENKKELARIYNNLGVIYRRLNQPAKSLMYLNNAIKNSENISQNDQQIFTNINTGLSFLYANSFKRADEYFENAKQLVEKSEDQFTQASAYNYLAMADYLSDRNKNALENAEFAMQIAERNKDSENLLASYKILALIYQNEEDYKNAQDFNQKYQELLAISTEEKQAQIKKSLQTEIEVERKEGELKSLIAEQQRQTAALTQSELERQKQEKEIQLKNKELDLLKRNEELQKSKIQTQQLEKQQVQQLLELVKQRAETDKQKLLAETQAQETEKQKLIAEKERSEKEGKQKELESAEVQKKLQAESLAQEKQIRYLGIGIGILLLFVLFFVIRGLITTRKLNKIMADKNDQIQAQNFALQQQKEEIRAQSELVEVMNKDLSEKNKNMTSSITYASRIQRGMLPAVREISAFIPEHFIVYKPKDIVSGDFYWFANYKGISYIAAADCTGHGVPGAMMSMIGSALLNNIIYEKNIVSPELILKELSEDIIDSLDQRSNDSRDGMDMTLCAIDHEQQKIRFSGAKNPLFYVQNGEIKEIKGAKHPIGDPFYAENRNFDCHEIDYAPNSFFYIFTDGFTDQFGGADKRKFGSKRLKEMILQNYSLSSAQQQHRFDQAISNWTKEGKESQTDDILLIGFSI
ncbi:MAG: hypothetical protein EAZ97_16065 [Bacteroidetes bacterium]|nr:MAG: hypothetical protein EAZ97_16065 [Bacteroidota bacterium]